MRTVKFEDCVQFSTLADGSTIAYVVADDWRHERRRLLDRIAELENFIRNCKALADDTSCGLSSVAFSKWADDILNSRALDDE